MVRDKECSSYPGFQLTSDFYMDLLEKVSSSRFKETKNIVRDNKSSSYREYIVHREKNDRV